MDDTASRDDHQALHFARHHAFIVGIDAYEKVSPLKTAVNDARRLAQVLAEKQHFDVHPPLLDARGAALRTLLGETMPRLVEADDRVLFYFAGHGIAADGDDGPAGYLVPADADPTDLKTFIPMAELQDALQALPCRHLLLILDCCFSGAFQWASRTRAIGIADAQAHLQGAVRSVRPRPGLAGHHLGGLRPEGDGRAAGPRHGRPRARRDPAGEAHSPFALALFDALAGDADFRTGREGDGVITATEVYAYVRDRVEPETIDAGQSKRQTPGFFPAAQARQGRVHLPASEAPAEPAAESRRAVPYKGLQSFDESDQGAVLRTRPRDSRAAGALRRGPAAGGERRLGHRQVVGGQGRPAAAAARRGASHPAGDPPGPPSAGGARAGAGRTSARRGRRRRCC